MLWIAGLGISGIESISIETQKLLKTADIVYLEQFTSPVTKLESNKIKKLVKGEFKIAKRWMVEDGKEILKNSKKKKVVLLTYGDPYIATTHIELRTRAFQEKIKTKTIHAASSITALVGECGLHYYKIGRIVTVMKDPKTLTTPYYVTYNNALAGNHTVLLLEYNQDEEFFLEPVNALSDLLSTEKEQKRKIISPSTFVIIASRIGFKNQAITAGKISNLIKKNFGKPPHTIIIPTSFSFSFILTLISPEFSIAWTALIRILLKTVSICLLSHIIDKSFSGLEIFIDLGTFDLIDDSKIIDKDFFSSCNGLVLTKSNTSLI